MSENTSVQTQPADLCGQGHEFITLAADVVTITRGTNTFAKSVPCPRCGKVFKLMAVRVKDGAGYLPEHHTDEWHKAQGKRAPKEPVAQVTLQEGETAVASESEDFVGPLPQVITRSRRSRSRKVPA
jgi:uncharacterized C2H2 Zn-finger protein